MSHSHGGGGGQNLPEWFDPKLKQFTRAWRQAMPPKGGYPAIRHRYLSPYKGVSLRVMAGLLLLTMIAQGFRRTMRTAYRKDKIDALQAQSQAAVPYYTAEYQLKNIIRDHYEKSYREFVAPEMDLDAKKFFTHAIEGALGSFLNLSHTKGGQPVVKAFTPIYAAPEKNLEYYFASDPYPITRSIPENKFDRMLGFAVQE